ncbi:hypothetical protein AOLI_G00061700 [Acnodon oligacanthus]
MLHLSLPPTPPTPPPLSPLVSKAGLQGLASANWSGCLERSGVLRPCFPSLRFIPGHTGAPGSPPRCGRPDQWQEASKQNDQGSPSKAPCPPPGHLVLSAGHGTPGPPGPPPPPLPFSRLSETRGGVRSATALAQSAHIERGPEVKPIHALSLI